METIGIIGGIAWPSTIVYYRIINELVAERLGEDGLHSAALVLAQTDFAEMPPGSGMRRMSAVSRSRESAFSM